MESSIQYYQENAFYILRICSLFSTLFITIDSIPKHESWLVSMHGWQYYLSKLLKNIIMIFFFVSLYFGVYEAIQFFSYPTSMYHYDMYWIILLEAQCLGALIWLFMKFGWFFKFAFGIFYILIYPMIYTDCSDLTGYILPYITKFHSGNALHFMYLIVLYYWLSILFIRMKHK